MLYMNYFNKDIEEVAKEFETDINLGLKSEEIEKKREKYGKNELTEKKKTSLFIKFLNEFKDFMIIVLIIAAIVSGIIGIKEVDQIVYKEDWQHTIGASIQRTYKKLVLEEENYEVII